MIEENAMALIVILDAGIGGISKTYELRKAIGRDHATTLVSRERVGNPGLGAITDEVAGEPGAIGSLL
jgi:hypothetical protein